MAETSTTTADRIYENLSQRIIRGELIPGEKLRQDHIARDFDASHVPVREALLKLQAHGLAVSLPRRGMRVSALDTAEIREITEMRLVLEELALRHACFHMTSEDFSNADAARRACDVAEDLPSWEARNRAFHRAILAPCDMPRLMASIDDLHIASARHLLSSWKSGWQQHEDKDHAAILMLMRRREVEAACDLLRRHLRRADRITKR
ncbi:Carbon starvation induced regulator [Thalassovita gelatinovora]|uniref:Carbon starvation induced regulator n=1 Tax=Thalassovita gelatinovora TaxID=53501 RepID=A0A0P1F935_THAGE|nr:GntR family transcriptional regulator [Thalassovita gelatinovora]QIZ81215.1 GntR family transcriptional regulator [Thalassovita gelatinovora]CUH64693.1 Carbon starvation induced regulator [Thalassovita gelatinovora]SEP93581.1 transcriptional regulator, GntR family [Thalassovita gelatinovora]